MEETKTKIKVEKKIDFNFNLIYPFASKPKIIPFLKKMIAIIFLVGCLFWYGVYIFSSLNVTNESYLAENLYKVTDESTYDAVGNLLPNTPRIVRIETLGIDFNNLFYTIYWNKLTYSLIFMLPLAAIYLLYQVFKKENYDKNIYGVSNWYVIISVGYFLLIAFMLFWDTNYLFYKNFENVIVTTENVQYVGSESITGNGIGFSINKKEFYWIKEIELKSKLTYQLTRWANIIMMVLLFFVVVFSILLIFLKPKIDRLKLIKIQKEIKKKAEANLKGKEYEVDPSIFQ